MRALAIGTLVIVSAASCSSDRKFEKAPGGAGTTGTAGADDGETSAGGAGAPGTAGDCDPGEYSADGICSPLTECGAGTFVSEEPTATTDRECKPCPDGTFNRDVNAVSCSTWSECGADESESVPPTATADRVCSPCGAGKYEASGECRDLTVCGAEQYESSAPTATSDRACADWTTCEAGSRQTAAPTATSDRRCQPCSSGTFSSQANAPTCSEWTVCGSNQNQTKAGTSTTDTMCVDKPVCSTAADRACTVECPCASTEGVCTKDEQCVSGTSCVADSGKKVGRTGNTCLATHCNNDKQDATETSVDCGGECGCRATYEVIPLKGLAQGTTWSSFNTMSRDGRVLAGGVTRGQATYPATIGPDGTVSELANYGKGGWIDAVNEDGSVLFGITPCANPPACSNTTNSIGKWTGSAPAVVLRTDTYSYSIRGTSISGGTVVGDYYDLGVQEQRAFVLSGTSWRSFSELPWVNGVSPDGRLLVGLFKGGGAGLFNIDTKEVTKIGITTGTGISAINGTDPVVIGRGYTSTGGNFFTGFRWKQGTHTELGYLTGATYTYPTAVSFDGGTIVGRSGAGGSQEAFVWTEPAKIRTIVAELRSRGLEPPLDLRLEKALFISDDGKTIVGIESDSPSSFWRVTLN